ncbi:hypothetical protein R2G56_00040 [Nitratireductor aquimarinus]|uniref:Uncharacterized protein n=1 Tax=Nitratireductor aquimarinus TaxID=889300 RepID=A0ABU4AEI2_9HYPH|nr:hypothetical protein [Nitratireductor aquimarinus]MDV6224666.1 hypothetical protein [Nitratireductor aquimarinus]
MNIRDNFDTLPEDMQAYAVAKAIDAIAAEVKAGAEPSRIVALANSARERAEALSEFLCPSNFRKNGRPPLYADDLPREVLAATYGENVVPFRIGSEARR